MRIITLLVVAAFAATSAGCMQDTEGTEFTLTGQVTDVRTDVEPDVEIEVDAQDADEDTDGEPDSSGAIQVRAEDVDEDLAECDLDEDAVPVFFTENTDFDPPETVEDQDFPENLEGAEVEVEGRVYGLGEDDGGEEDAGCALVADEIELSEDGGAPTASPAPGGAATATPSTPSPTPTGAEVTPTPTVGETFIPPTPSP